MLCRHTAAATEVSLCHRATAWHSAVADQTSRVEPSLTTAHDKYATTWIGSLKHSNHTGKTPALHVAYRREADNV